MNAIVETLTEDMIAVIQADAKRVATDHYASIAAAARDAGIAESTFHAFINGSYSGKNEVVAVKAKAWLSSREERAKTAATLPKAPGFQATPTAQKFLPVLTWAQVAPDFTALVGAPGVGKTTTLEYYRDTTPNVFLATAEPSTSGANPMLREICRVMDINERSATELSRAIGNRVKGIQALIIVDEAQHLGTPALEQLRALHDRYKVGVALCGNRTVHARLYGEGKEGNAQLFSRVGMKVKAFQPAAGDLCMMITAWAVSEKPEIDFLKVIGRKPGALRNLDKVMKLASMLAAGADEPRALKHIRAAWEQLDVNLAADAV